MLSCSGDTHIPQQPIKSDLTNQIKISAIFGHQIHFKTLPASMASHRAIGGGTVPISTWRPPYAAILSASLQRGGEGDANVNTKLLHAFSWVVGRRRLRALFLSQPEAWFSKDTTLQSSKLNLAFCSLKAGFWQCFTNTVDKNYGEPPRHSPYFLMYFRVVCLSHTL